MICLCLVQAWADQPAAGGATTGHSPIHISADRLVLDNAHRWAEFQGRVQAVQGQVQIDADRMRIYYTDGKQQQPSPENEQGIGRRLERIEAYGNVRIVMDNRVAVTPKAVYSTADQTLTLQGEGSRLTSGKDEILGTTIVFFRRQGRVKVEGAPGKRVRAILHGDMDTIQ